MLAEYPPATPEKVHTESQDNGSAQEEQKSSDRENYQQIRQAVETIFSDENLAKDQFMKELVGQTPEGCKCILGLNTTGLLIIRGIHTHIDRCLF